MVTPETDELQKKKKKEKKNTWPGCHYSVYEISDTGQHGCLDLTRRILVLFTRANLRETNQSGSNHHYNSKAINYSASRYKDRRPWPFGGSGWRNSEPSTIQKKVSARHLIRIRIGTRFNKPLFYFIWQRPNEIYFNRQFISADSVLAW